MLIGPDIARMVVPGAAIAHCRLPAWRATDYVSRSSTSSIGYSFTRQNCVVDVAGRADARVVDAASIVMIGAEPIKWLSVEQPCEIIEISGDADLRSIMAEELGIPYDADLADLNCPGNPIAWAIAARLRALARADGPIDSLEVESLVRRLYAHMLIAHFGGRLREKGDGALDMRRLARVADYIDDHLGEDLSLTALADVAALSPFHFQRSFRRATGATPHHYVALRRAERARQLIAEGRPQDQIASAVGYGNRRRLRAALAEARF